jgi:hypothetical protein
MDTSDRLRQAPTSGIRRSIRGQPSSTSFTSTSTSTSTTLLPQPAHLGRGGEVPALQETCTLKIASCLISEIGGFLCTTMQLRCTLCFKVMPSGQGHSLRYRAITLAHSVLADCVVHATLLIPWSPFHRVYQHYPSGLKVLNMTHLDISSNTCSALPGEIGQLTGLKTIHHMKLS